MPLIKAGATIGTAAIPGAGPVLAPIVGGLMTAGQGMAGGQGPLTSLTQGAIQGGMQAGIGALGDMMQGGEGVADTSQLGVQGPTFVDQGMQQTAGIAGGDDPLTRWAQDDLMKRFAQRNTFMGKF